MRAFSQPQAKHLRSCPESVRGAEAAFSNADPLRATDYVESAPSAEFHLFWT
jgi:hypothetical protein